jgi:hypothetical protein
MIKIKQVLRPLSIAVIIASTIITASIRLSSLNYKSASVLPYYHHNNKKWIILSREAFGADKGTYDDFGGAKDPGEKRPVATAAREFNEEGILSKIINITVPQTIDLLRKNSSYIISYSNQRGTCNVTYITNFNNYKDQFFNNFYTARSNAHGRKYKEKDKIAVVTWNNLKYAIIKHAKQADSFMGRWFGHFSSQNVTVSALELDPTSLQFKPTTITLRPFLVKKLKLFFLNKPYAKEMNKKIRHYSEH